MKRRAAIKTIGLATAGVSVANGVWALPNLDESRHIITLSFDDGFKSSTIKTAEIFEKHGLPACINVIASGHLPDFKVPDEYQVTEKGDFVLWNDLLARGHEVMPHTYKHANLTEMPLSEAQDLITACLDYFTENLKGFEAKNAIYNFAYNASTPEIEEWLAKRVRAYRTGGSILNPLPHNGQQKLTCGAFGPGNTENYLDSEIEKLLSLPSGWLIYNAHGLDGEGWGPMRSEYLESLLARLKKIETVKILPVGPALDLING